MAAAPARHLSDRPVVHGVDGPDHGAGIAPAPDRATAGRHGSGVPPAQMGRHGRGHHRPAALGREGGGRPHQGHLGPRRQAGARRRAALVHRRARPGQGSGRMGLLRPARPDCPDPAAAPAGLQALAPDAPRHAAALPGLCVPRPGAHAAGLLGAAAGPAAGRPADPGQRRRAVVAGGRDRAAPAPRRAYPQRAAVGPGAGRTTGGGLRPAR